MRGKRRLLGVLVALAAAVLAAPSAAMACPGDGGPAPAEIKNHFCGTWNAAEARGLNPGTPLNNAFRFGGGWWRDFDGGAFGRGAIVEGDGVGFAYVVGQPWFNTYTGLGGPNSPLGYPVGRAEFGGHINTGARENKYMTFQGGVMNSWAAGTFATWGAIRTKWDQLGHVSGPVGRPLSNEQQTARVNGRYSVFEGGNIIYNPRINVASLVYGGILNKYGQLGYSNHPLGLPTGDRQYNAFKGNEYQVFDGGVINQYGGRAFATYGALLAKWQALGGANGPVGLPTSDEQQTARVPGRYATFQGGNLIFNPATGQTAHVYGGILNKYAQLGYSNHPLGLPTSDRRRNPKKGNEYQTFQGGVINQYGGRAFETHGAILRRWERSGGANGPLGLPTSDDQYTSRSPQNTIGRYARFQKGLINYHPGLNRAFVLFGAIGGKYASLGYSASYLGLPTSEEFNAGRGRKRQNFQGGFIRYTHGTGAKTNRELRGGSRETYRIRAIGDSYTGGLGLSLGPASGKFCFDEAQLPSTRCDDVSNSWADRTVRSLLTGSLAKRTGNYANLAVSGSQTSDWLNGDSDRGDVKDFRARFASVIRARPHLILMSLGANDVLGKDEGCQRDAACVNRVINGSGNDSGMRKRLTAILRRLMTGTRARIYVLLYPPLRGDKVNAVGRTNEAIKAAIRSTGYRVKYIPSTSFAGHDCGDASRGSWRLGWDRYKSFPLGPCLHPNRAGSQALAKQALQTIRRYGR